MTNTMSYSRTGIGLVNSDAKLLVAPITKVTDAGDRPIEKNEPNYQSRFVQQNIGASRVETLEPLPE